MPRFKLCAVFFWIFLTADGTPQYHAATSPLHLQCWTQGLDGVVFFLSRQIGILDTQSVLLHPAISGYSFSLSRTTVAAIGKDLQDILYPSACNHRDRLKCGWTLKQTPSALTFQSFIIIPTPGEIPHS
ncbi:hypothetical protein QBC44DRAFT_89624 [Cladorrhinum sp. PSN332]|nr:hypothetical protein QBC44DRAFT_89624 [Cladorrhinum sp. PSN332]